MKKFLRTAGADVPAAVVVFLVALPLCLGVAQASGAPLFAGIIAGVIGGIVVGAFSGSNLSISGPAAGLTAIVAVALHNLPFQSFLLCVVIAGVFQLALGFLKAGFIGDFVPNSVIKGMLAAIGLILILKEVPHLVGYDKDYIGDEDFSEANGENTFSAFTHSLRALTRGAIIIGGVSLAILMFWESKIIKRNRILQLIPGPLLVVIAGVGINQLFATSGSLMTLGNGHLVALPVTSGISGLASLFVHPDFGAIFDHRVWGVALTIAIVASLETLLSIEAVDKLDPLKRVTPTNRELKAQGIGNLLSGLVGGLPVTSVIVRSSANVNAGGKSKLSAILHGVLLLLSAIFLVPYINKIPVAALAAILIFTGFKLAKPTLFVDFYRRGFDQFIPLVATITAILMTDLLRGILVGIVVSLIFLLRSGFRSSVVMGHEGKNYTLQLRKDVSFLNKSMIKTWLETIPANTTLLIDTSLADFIDKDVIEEINNFMVHAYLKNIEVSINRSTDNELHQKIQEPVLPKTEVVLA